MRNLFFARRNSFNMVNKKRGFRLLSLVVPNLVKFGIATTVAFCDNVVRVEQPLSCFNKPQMLEVNLFPKKRHSSHFSFRPLISFSKAVESVVKAFVFVKGVRCK